MTETILKFADVQELARVLEPFSSRVELTLFSLATFADGRARVGDGVVGVEAPFASLDGFALPVAMLVGPAMSLKSDVRVWVKDGTVTLEAGNFRGRVQVAAKERAAAWPSAPQKKSWTPFSSEAWSAAQSVAFAVGTDHRLALSAVKLTAGQAVAVDGLRLSRAAAKGAPDLLLPARLLEACAAAFPETAPTNVVPDDGGRVWLRFGDTLCWSLLPAEDFPSEVLGIAARRSKEAGANLSATWEAANATAALARVSPFADSGLIVKAEGKLLTFEARSQRGEARESISAEVLKQFEIEAAPALLADAFGRAEGCAVPENRECLVFRRRGWELVVMAMVK